jgi:hypothetical protein
VQAPQIFPYYPKQVNGILGGIKAAAEYESILADAYPDVAGTENMAIVRMGPQTIAHLIIIFFILLGNVSYFLSRKKKIEDTL